MNNINEKGVVIAEILEKNQRASQFKKSFWMLKLSIRKNLTEIYFGLIGRVEQTLKSLDEPMFVFTEKGRFSNTLLPGNIYFFEFNRKLNESGKYYHHLKDWIKLGNDKRVIERVFRLLINEGTRKKVEKKLTNTELLQELDKRMRSGQINFKLEANNKGSAEVLENTGLGFDFELKDRDSDFSLDLQKNEEEKLADEFLQKHNRKENGSEES